MKKADICLIALLILLVPAGWSNSETEPGVLASFTVVSTEKTTPELTEAPESESRQVEVAIYAKVSEKSLLGEYTYSDYVIKDNGQILQFTQYQSQYGKKQAIETTYLEYNDEGQLISKKEVSRYGYDQTNYIYNKDGLVEREYSTSDFSIQNGNEFVYTYTFDQKGRIETKKAKNVNSDYWLEYSYIYNNDGLIERERQHSKNSTYIIYYIYDEHGNPIEEHVSELNNPTNGWVNYYTYACIGTYTIYEPESVDN